MSSDKGNNMPHKLKKFKYYLPALSLFPMAKFYFILF